MGNQALSLRPEVLNDLENSTAFSADEIREYYRTFLKECASGKMTMSVEDLAKIYEKFFPNGNSTKFAEHVFTRFDTDRSGKIDFREFLSALSIQLKGTIEEKLEWAFNLYDLDGTGFIEKNELVEIARTIKANQKHGHTMEGVIGSDDVTPQQIADYIMQKADENGDNKLSKKEFVDAAIASKTIRSLVIGTLNATGSPFTKRKNEPA